MSLAIRHTTQIPHGWRLSTVSHRAHLFIVGDEVSACGQSSAAVVRALAYDERPPRCRACANIAASMGSVPNAERFRTSGLSAGAQR